MDQPSQSQAVSGAPLPAVRLRSKNNGLSLAALLESLYDAILITNRAGGILEANRRAQELTQYARAELERLRLGDLVAGVDANLLAAIEQHWAAGRFTVIEGRCRRKDGSVFPAEIAAGGLHGPAGSGWCFSLRNITRRKQAEESIRKEAEQQLLRAREQNEFEGQLNILSLSDIIQLIDSAGKSGLLELTRAADGAAAVMAFEAGRVIHAACGGQTGAEAFYAALALGGNAFRFRQAAAPPPDPGLTESTMSLLLEGMRRLDEAAKPAE